LPLRAFPSSSAHHHPLHPFPTRRSSDLSTMATRPGTDSDTMASTPSDRFALECRQERSKFYPGSPVAPHPSPPSATVAASSCVPDRKSTRLNSSHVKISYAVFCLKKKTV